MTRVNCACHCSASERSWKQNLKSQAWLCSSLKVHCSVVSHNMLCGQLRDITTASWYTVHDVLQLLSLGRAAQNVLHLLHSLHCD